MIIRTLTRKWLGLHASHDFAVRNGFVDEPAGLVLVRSALASWE
jgi:hypothetical protein